MAPPHEAVQDESYVAYVDGSFCNGLVGYGAVILKDGCPVVEFFGKTDDEYAIRLRQVSGELEAVRHVLEWCVHNKVPKLVLFYDYEGVEKWATGEWRPDNPVTRAYVDYLRNVHLEIRWAKVKSHSGDRWNTYADTLARRSCMQSTVHSQLSGALSVADLAASFTEYLLSRGLDVRYEGIINEQFARIRFLPREGYIDIYNSRRRSFKEPYYHGFHNTSLLDEVKTLWDTFVREEDAESETVRFLNIMRYYYEILKPYKECAFDFYVFAQSIYDARCTLGMRAIDVDAVRFDFESLEKLYLETIQGGETDA